jgi:spermidine synthase
MKMSETTHFEGNWFSEISYKKTYAQSFKVKEVLFREKSPFQLVEVLDTESVGRLLLLDGKTMVSDIDEFVYHESIAHVPAMTVKNLKKVLVVGGGDGGAVREFVRHPEVESVDLVEIDDMVIEASRKFFPGCSSALDHPKVKIYREDGIKFIQNNKNTYDVIVVDSTDPEDFAQGLFQEDFYRDVYDSLTENGVLTAQTENPFLDEFNIKGIYDNLRKVFPKVYSYNAPIVIYPGCFWTFAYASKGPNPLELNPEKISWMKEQQKTLQWYNCDWHKGAFALSNLQKKITGVGEV